MLRQLAQSGDAAASSRSSSSCGRREFELAGLEVWGAGGVEAMAASFEARQFVDREREKMRTVRLFVSSKMFSFSSFRDFIIIIFSDVRILFRLIARLFSRGWRVLFYPKDLSTEIKCMAMHRDSRVDASKGFTKLLAANKLNAFSSQIPLSQRSRRRDATCGDERAPSIDVITGCLRSSQRVCDDPCRTATRVSLTSTHDVNSRTRPTCVIDMGHRRGEWYRGVPRLQDVDGGESNDGRRRARHHCARPFHCHLIGDPPFASGQLVGCFWCT